MKRVWIVGAGKRVRATALPALASMPEHFQVRSILARSVRELEAAGRTWSVRALASLEERELADGDVLYVAVGKDAVPAVLTALARFDRSRLELLIDTPVLRFKHLRHRALLDGWRRASVAEDTAYLPWYATARAALGPITSVVFDRAAYAYHGHAQAKALLGAARIVRARRWRTGPKAFYRSFELDDGRTAGIVEPRDYAAGRVILQGACAALADRWDPDDELGRSPAPPPGWRTLDLAPIVERGLCVGFRAADVETRLEPSEAELTRGDPEAASITARMESMKRIGFRRLLQSIAEGRGAYPIEQGLDDTAVDWFLERFGRWSANGLLDVRRPLPRALWSVLGRLR